LLAHPLCSALKILQTKKRSSKLGVFLFVVFIRDLDRIQTCNLLSRNQMRYSVAPRGRFKVGANIILLLKNNQTIYFKILIDYF
jgi:hypothetical protein